MDPVNIDIIILTKKHIRFTPWKALSYLLPLSCKLMDMSSIQNSLHAHSGQMSWVGEKRLLMTVRMLNLPVVVRIVFRVFKPKSVIWEVASEASTGRLAQHIDRYKSKLNQFRYYNALCRRIMAYRTLHRRRVKITLVAHTSQATPNIDLCRTRIRGCIQKFPDWPPGPRTANGRALCH
jgi:hypothetical protein